MGSTVFADEAPRKPSAPDGRDSKAGQPSGMQLVWFAEIQGSSNHPRRMRRFLISIGLLCALVGCRQSSESNPEGAAAAPVVAADTPPTPSGEKPSEDKPQRVVTPDQIAQITNPGGAPSYTGATGTVAGTVRVTGDPAPPLELGTAKIPLGDCFEAHSTYKSLFREGPDRVLADVLVAVTGYSGYLPPPDESVQVVAKGCAFDTRTVAMMFGQGLKVQNRGKEAVTPELLGAPTRAWLVAIPGGAPIELFPQKIGLHKLIDRSHEFSFADVYVVPYRTTDVTGLDGRFEIRGVPVGSLKINALLPATGQTVEQSIEVSEGKTTEVDLSLSFDQASLKPAAPSTSAPKPPAPKP